MTITATPWKKEKISDDLYLLWGANNTFIADVHRPHGPIWRSEANINLMEAAPDMLMALESLYTNALDREETTDDSGQEYDDWRVVRLAIAKAKGEQP